MATWLKRIFIGAASFVLTTAFVLPAYSETIKVRLKEGTFVPLRITQSISSEDCVRDQNINFEVTQAVRVNGHVVITAGALSRGQVDECVKTGIGGQPGRLRIMLISVRSVDDQHIPLRGTATRVGEEKVMHAIGGAVICLPLAFMRGEPTSFPTGTEFQAFTAGDREIEVRKK